METMDVLLDVSPVQVSGPMRAVKARVVYAVADGVGKLYVARGSQDVTSYDVPEPTKTDPRRHQYAAESIGLSFYRRGCGSCGYTLARVPVADLIAVAKPASA